MILESYAEVASKQFTFGKTPHQLVHCSRVPKNKNKKYKHVNQHTIPFTKNQKLITCWATTVSCEFNWIYQADFRLISLAPAHASKWVAQIWGRGSGELQPPSPPRPVRLWIYNFLIKQSLLFTTLLLWCFAGRNRDNWQSWSWRVCYHGRDSHTVSTPSVCFHLCH